jgi:hypothetical protein
MGHCVQGRVHIHDLQATMLHLPGGDLMPRRQRHAKAERSCAKSSGEDFTGVEH